MQQIIALAGALSFILILELFGWRCFRAKIEGIHFDRKLDTSFFRFFSLGRVRTVAVTHSVFMLITVGAGLLFLW